MLILDYQQDTLWKSQELRADLFFEELLKNSIVIEDLILQNATAKVYQQVDGYFNYEPLLSVFSDTTTVIQDGEQSEPWRFALKKIVLGKVDFQYKSLEDKLNLKAELGGLRANIHEMDIAALKVHIDYLDLKDAALVFKQGLLATQKQNDEIENGTPPPDILLKEVSLNNVSAVYQDSISAQKIETDITNARLVARKMSLIDKEIVLNKASLYDSEIAYESWTETDSTKESTIEEKVVKEKSWYFRLYELEMAGNSFSYDQTTVPTIARGLDYNHILIYDQSTYAENIIFGDTLLKGNISQLSFTEKSGFRVKRFNTSLSADNKKLVMRNFLMETDNSLLNEYIALEYDGLKNLADTLENLQINVSLNRAKIGLTDILYFQPDFYEIASERSLKKAIALVDLRLKGSLNKLDIQKCNVSLLNNSFAHLNGTVSNLLGNIKTDITFDTLNVSGRDVENVLQGVEILEQFDVPNNTGLNGFIKGSLTAFEGKLNMHSTIGDVDLGIVQKVDSTQIEPAFNAVLKLSDLQIGSVLKMTDIIGSVTSDLVISGTGLTESNPKGDIKGTILNASLLGYPYQNASFDGAYSLEGFNGNFSVDDPNVKLDYEGEVKYTNDNFSSNFEIDLSSVNLTALGFAQEDYRNLNISTKLTSRLRRNSEGYFNGELFLKDLMFTQNDKNYLLRNLEAFVAEKVNQFDLSLRSDWLDLKANSNASSSLLIQQIPSVFYNYYAFTSTEPTSDSIPRNLKLEGELKNTNIITQLFYTDLQRLSSGRFNFNFNQDSKNISAAVNFPQFRYADTDFNDFEFKLDGNANELAYKVGVSRIITETFRIVNPSISGQLKNDNLYTKLNLNDSLETEQFVIGGVLTGRDSSFKFQFNPEKFKLNYKKWEVPEDNAIVFQNNLLRSKGLFFKEFEGNESFQIEINGSDSTQTDLLASFENFEMSFLTKAVQSKENLLGGTINGTLSARDITDTLKVNADFEIANLELLGDTLGNISFHADNEDDIEVYSILTTLTERGNDVNVSGTYRVVSTKNPVNLVIKINQFNVGTIKNLAFGQVSDLEGSLENSRIVFRGNADQPIVRGSIYIPSLAFHSNYLNSGFSLTDERIRFTSRGIHLEKFLLKDEQDRAATVDGDIFTTNYTDYNFDLNISTDNFLVLNTNANDNELFYGKVLTSSRLNITGTPALPKINMTSTILEGTTLTYILPDENLETVNRAGVVEFVDMDADSSLVLLEKEEIEDEIEGFDLEVNIEVDNNAEMTIIIDPEAGDKITVRGGGNLSFAMNPAGTMTLAGIYTIEEGNYLLTFYDLVKRRFSIKPGSQLIWTGDPYDANLDITALYETKAIPYELFPPTDNPDEVRARQQQLPFIVGLTMKGALDAPEVLFDIQLPELNKGALNGTVNAQLQRLNQEEAALNKQVFALLILNSFISTNPFEGTGQNNLVSSTARTSVSRLLTQQLNRLSSRYLKGLDINFELNSYDDYASGSVGGRTELGVELSKKLFNERVSINVGGNVNLTGEGQEQAAQQNTQQIAGNVSLEYKLSRDGRYRLRAYRRNAFEGLIDGDFIETGVSLIFTKDYNRVRELFKNADSRNQNKKKGDKSPAKNSETPKIEDDN